MQKGSDASNIFDEEVADHVSYPTSNPKVRQRFRIQAYVYATGNGILR
jgi:hypothetical protein